MFLGTYEPKLDEKGRLILPARFRDQLASGIVLTPGQERCIYAFPTSEFENIYEEMRQAPLTHKQARSFSRVMLSGASDQIPDKQGRINIPANLRQYAGLGKDLTVIGAGARMEIWDAKTWNNYLAESEDAFAEVAEEIVPGLL
ncbi:MAG: division/cell wall cluster transcriptional repressor MraZ [Mobiluncus porci]|uniref:Transcriptional regulator MraZ n=1 Tax=Mobiluncus porci TaxID=2652278 RepID=A0A7K0K2X0_9ACTO|nr:MULTISPECIES: division/cell wall cluster transcriptional repressor MraZ [Mobiluncus]MCI6584160.1 division/cell wall cluster transcriptional repressor MraZ [Mobiluncus sp.]MDD7542312.1 division/cell wall cluster transcriptional repressor MraZ [Mobiluncus porci]MDY5749111.1 division/cell wall cluster transcriptional repressor MraZ [Mobiluncus porci]MST49837.1 division/cell wall cluster transcriptional repressor MraZ [Mobiluncus porci]